MYMCVAIPTITLKQLSIKIKLRALSMFTDSTCIFPAVAYINIGVGSRV